ncbi:MAG: type IV secretion system DNA-binding domain-containing protein [Patescibacteria group bacterium]
MTIIFYIGIFLLLIAVWAVIVYMAFWALQYRRYRDWLSKQNYTTLLIKVPKNNEKTALSAEQMYASLHGIYRNYWTRLIEGSLQEHISLEIVSSNKYIKFYTNIPTNLVEFVEGQIYAQYPTVLIEKVEDYTTEQEGRNFASCELVLERNDAYPIRTFESFDVDPLAGVTAVLSKIGDAKNQIWVQFLVKPIDNRWQLKSQKIVQRIKGERNLVLQLLNQLRATATSDETKETKKELTGPEREAVEQIESKTTKLGYEVKIRLICFGDDPFDAKNKLKSIIGTFKQFNLTNLNGFVAKKISTNDNKELEAYKKRSFWSRGYVLNVTELASLFHLPSINVATPAIVWSTSKVAEPPSNLPTPDNTDESDLTVFAKTDFRGLENQFGIKTDDRSKHMYIVGKTGMGKTSLLQNMVIDDMRKGRGLAVVDPHGDFVDTVLNYIPSDRINDVVLFDPGDRDNPIAFNLLEQVEDDFKPIVTSGLIAIFKKLWSESWGPRLEHILRYTFLALLDYPQSTFLHVPRLLTDETFRREVLKKVNDPVVKDFWEVEFNGYPDKMRQEAISPIQNKIGQFLASTTIRNIVGQPVTSMNMREIMDKEQILLIKVAKGIVGEDNAALLGAMMITKMQLAAMSRADVPVEQRVPFNLYVDEFQNFATESFASILSEARKYKLNLHVANQYIEQMEDVVRGAVFGNVGTLVTFRVGATDADYLAKEFAPTFTPEDLTNLEKFHIYLRMTIDGISSPAFSGMTLSLPDDKTSNREKVVRVSRERYGRQRQFVEGKIREWADEVVKQKAISQLKQKQEKQEKKMFRKIQKKSTNKDNPGENYQSPVNLEVNQARENKLLSKLKVFQKTRQDSGTNENDDKSLVNVQKGTEAKTDQKYYNKLKDFWQKRNEKNKVEKKVDNNKKKGKTADIGEVTINPDGSIVEVELNDNGNDILK